MRSEFFQGSCPLARKNGEFHAKPRNAPWYLIISSAPLYSRGGGLNMNGPVQVFSSQLNKPTHRAINSCSGIGRYPAGTWY